MMTDNLVKCLHSLFAKDCRVEPDGLMSLISIYSSVSPPQMPANIPLCFVCFLELDLEKYKETQLMELETRVLINAPWGPNISDTRTNAPFIQISEKTARSAVSIPFGKVQFYEYGEYEVQVFINDRLIHTTHFNIIEPENAP
jgi:hypothetical protein